MARQKMPTDTAGWHKYLAANSLPATPGVGKSVLWLLKCGTPSYNTLAKLISTDPVLSYHLIAHANRLAEAMGETAQSNPRNSASLNHAISMMGVNHVRQVVSKLPYFKPDPTNIRHFCYLRALNTSLLSAFLAKEISKTRSALNEDALFWGALYSGTPQWFLWRFATPEMRLVRYAVKNNNQSQEEAEMEILGCTSEAISRSLIKTLAVPDLSKQALAGDTAPDETRFNSIACLARDDMPPNDTDDRHIHHLMNQPVFVLKLCHRLANSAAQDWYSATTHHYQQVLAVFMRLPTPKAIAMTHRVAAAMSRAYHYPGVMTPAAKLFLPGREYIEFNSFDDEIIDSLLARSEKCAEQKSKPARKGKQDSGKELSGETPATTHPANETESATLEKAQTHLTGRKRNQAMFDTLVCSMNERPEEFADIHSIMDSAVQGLVDGLGMQRCTAALVNTRVTRLKAYYTRGTDDYEELGSFQIDLTRPSLFRRLLDAPASIWVKPESRPQVWDMIPDEFKRISGAGEFFLMSVFVEKKPVAVFYCDAGPDPIQPLTDLEYRQFKAICKATGNCLLFHTNNQ
ncbi:MAG: hypothetical protein CSB48_09285 [Proteobacteria bacterium]|nr:MAG: hypothetical protein CSB48_09285 [Pseudomonadota bacterium]PIE39982.1 MAG: hypothetical protein CSA51_03170 [Gammaproteobacteria bacterium]